MIRHPRALFEALFDIYGPQNWWPADSPFEVMVGAVLTQNTAWVNVEKAITCLRERIGVDPRAISSVDPATLAEAIRPSGYFNIKSRRLQAYCRWYLQQGELESLQQRKTDELRRMLLGVHGIGPETADDILLYAFGRNVFVVDTYTRRLFYRLGFLPEDAQYETVRAYVEQKMPDGAAVFNEFHALIVRHAKEACGKSPGCEVCTIRTECRYGRGGR